MHSIRKTTAGLVFALLACTSGASEPPSGIWFWADKGENSNRTVLIKQSEGDTSIKVDDVPVTVIRNGDLLSFELENQERFEGKIEDRKTITGTWYQPSGEYFYSAMATQIELTAADDDWFANQIKLQPRPFHLFLDFFQDESGNPFAVIRNPERNDILRATRFSVSPDSSQDNRWFLEAGSGNRKVSIPITVSQESIEMTHFQVNGAVKFTRAKKAESQDLNRYYSRTPSDPARLSDVPQLNDGWQVRSAADAGFNLDKLNSLVSYLASQDPRDTRPQLLHSLLVSHRGHLVVEEYFYGHSRDEVHDSRSMAKVFGTVLIGAAKQQGFDISVDDTPLPGILKAHKRKPTPQDSDITLEHLLTYTTGLDTSEDEQSQGSEDRMWQQNENFWLFAALLDKKHTPGSVYAYSSASAHMVGAAIEQSTNMTVRDFFHRKIAEPLDFSAYHWNLTPDGTSYLGGGIYLTPRDALKIGALYSQGGRWYGQQILPEKWVEDSTMARLDITPETTGLSEADFSNIYFPGQQAYLWRVDELESGGRTYGSYLATGNGGQMIVVIPELELAVGFTGGNYRMGYIWWRWSQTVIGEYLIPALVNNDEP